MKILVQTTTTIIRAHSLLYMNTHGYRPQHIISIPSIPKEIPAEPCRGTYIAYIPHTLCVREHQSQIINLCIATLITSKHVHLTHNVHELNNRS